MAQRKITNISSGVYFNEIDLTVVTASVGQFAGAATGLMEKGPAFEIMQFATFEERAVRMGDLNPNFLSSYYAREFLAQANNYKECRILGLEGYNEDTNIDPITGLNSGGTGKCFVVQYDKGGAAAGAPIRISDIQPGSLVAAQIVAASGSYVANQTIVVDGVQGILEAITDEGVATGGTTGTIILGAGASSADGYYVGKSIRIVAGTSANDIRTITGYVGSTKVATVNTNFTLAPDGTSDYVIVMGSKPLQGTYFVKSPVSHTFSLYSSIVSGSEKKVYTTGTWIAGTGTILSNSPVSVGVNSIAAVLKPRRGSDWVVDYVTVATMTQNDGVTNAATDDLFKLIITFEGAQNVYTPKTLVCSLRPESSQYLPLVFGTDPMDNVKVLGAPSPLWVEFIWPSVKSKLDSTDTNGYFYPGDEEEYDPQDPAKDIKPSSYSTLTLIDGNATVSKYFTYPTLHVTNVTTTSGVHVTTTLTHGFTAGMEVTLTDINGVTIPGANNTQVPIDGNWYVAASPVPGASDFYIVDSEGNPPAGATGSLTEAATSGVKKTYTPTWESELMDLGGKEQEIPFQTPLTPWFVSDFDDNGNFKRLFKVWSISDGEAADTEIKIEISNVNPDGNNGNGSFDLYVRAFGDSEDTGRSVYEGYANLSMDKKSTNYILKRIGDGDRFPLKSKFIFIELNDNDTIPKTALPYGVEGYPNLKGGSAPDLRWTTQYNLNKPLSRQSLGSASNSVNAQGVVEPDMLSFKNWGSNQQEYFLSGSYDDSETALGKGFHLNPRYVTAQQTTSVPGQGGLYNPTLYDTMTTQLGFALVDHRAYNTSSSDATKVQKTSKVSRMKFVVNLFGGFDGFNVYSERAWNDTTSKDFEALGQALDALSDFESLYADFSVLVTPDINYEMHPEATSSILEMCEYRGDAMYLFDFNYGYDSGAAPEINPNSAKIALDYSTMKSSFCATYYPDCQISDERNNVNVWCPPSIIALATIASTATNENVWQPPAGSLRTVTDNLIRTRKRMKLPDREILKSASINPITEFPGSGFEITESRTTQPVFSALSFIHNRLLLGYAKKILNQTLRPLLQQLKTENLRDTFINTVTPIFARIKRLNGLEEFSVVSKGLDEDQTTLHGQIIITPLYPVERIIVDFVLKNGEINYSNQ